MANTHLFSYSNGVGVLPLQVLDSSRVLVAAYDTNSLGFDTALSDAADAAQAALDALLAEESPDPLAVQAARDALLFAWNEIEGALYDLAVADNLLSADTKTDIPGPLILQTAFMRFETGTVEEVPETQDLPDLMPGAVLVALNDTPDTVYINGEVNGITGYAIPTLGRRLFFRVIDGIENGAEVIRWVTASLPASEVQTNSVNNIYPDLQQYLDALIYAVQQLSQSAVIVPQGAPSNATAGQDATAPSILSENVSITLITEVAGVLNATNARVNVLFTREAALAASHNALVAKVNELMGILKNTGTLVP